MMLLRKHLLSLLRAASPLSSQSLPRRSLILFSTSTSIPPAPFSLEAYLVTACGLTPDQALKASAKASKEASKRLKEHSCPFLSSASNPDAVLALLSGAGLSRPEIAAIVAADPLLLRASVEDVAPRLAALRDRIGLSAPQIAGFLLVGSRILFSNNMLPNLEFLVPLFGSFEQLLPVIKSSYKILASDPETVIKPNIAHLSQCGLSVNDIVKLSSSASWVLIFNPKRVEEFVRRADELGVPRSSGMFRHALAAVAGVNQEKVAAKMEFFRRTLGCSETEIGIAVCKQPLVLKVVEETFRLKSEFLIKQVGLEPDYIAKRPELLMLSLTRRLLPRHYVMKVLQEKGLLKKSGFYTLAKLSEEAFKSSFVDCHEKIVPGLAAAYSAACAGEVPSQVQL